MNKFLAGWYLLYIRPRHEKKVHERLTEIKLTSFLPTRKVLRMWHDRKRFVDEPLFPSYVFIYLKSQENFYQGLGIDGVLYYVRSGKEVARVSETIIDSIRLMASSGYDLDVSRERFEAGRQLVIPEGVLAGLSCEVVKYQGKDKVLLRVHLLRQNILLSMHPDHLLATT